MAGSWPEKERARCILQLYPSVENESFTRSMNWEHVEATEEDSLRLARSVPLGGAHLVQDRWY